MGTMTVKKSAKVVTVKLANHKLFCMDPKRNGCGFRCGNVDVMKRHVASGCITNA